MHPGSQQDQRLSPALMPGYFQPDELSLAQRLRQTLEWARQVRFVDTQGSETGDWGQMLAQDLSWLLAELAALPLPALQAQADQFAWLPPERAQAMCLALAQRLDQWISQLDADTQGLDQSLRQALRVPLTRALTDALGPQLQALLKAMGHSGPLRGRGWHPAWGLSTPEADPDASPAALQRHLRLFWLAMCRVMRLLQALAAQHLPDSLQTGRHDPGSGLLLAWTQLLQGSRETLNRFDSRLIQHYYHERLGFRPAAAQADRVHLVLERDPRYTKPVMLPLGWRWVANLDQGSCSFAAEQALHLSPLRVSQLLSLRQVYDPKISPEREYGLATQALARHMTPPSTEQAAEARAPSVPLLGGGPGSLPARQGLAIASSLLSLREGRRDITVTLAVAAPAGADAALPTEASEPAWQAWYQRLSSQEQAQGLAPSPPPGWAPGAASPRTSAALLPTAWRALLHDCPGLQQTPWLTYLLLRCLDSQQPATLAPRLGRLLAAWLCATGPELDPTACTRLRQHARQVLADNSTVDVDDPLSLLFSDAPLERSLVFDRVFRGAWEVLLSGPEGWLALGEAFVTMPAGQPARHQRPGDTPPACTGLCLSVSLSADQPAIVAACEALHGPGWPALPVLQLRVHHRSRLFVGSLLQQLELQAAEVAVQVEGARCLQVHNQLGQLDPSKPFMPLGPLPDASAYLVFTHAELAAKPLERLQLHLRWSGLPAQGLARHYAAYPGARWQESDFRVQMSLLSEGRWQAANGPSLPLFGPRGSAVHSLAVAGNDLLRLHNPVALPAAAPGGGALEPRYGLGSRQGFFRLQLASPPEAFGHALYPRLLADTLTANSRLKPALARPLPLPPYTPVLDAMTVDYSARQRISPRPTAEQVPHGELLYITPFGLQPLRQLPQVSPVPVLQHWAGDGQLFIGLDGPSAEGSLSLLFRLRSEAAQEALGRATPQLQWHAWCGDDWQLLEPHRVLLDSTEGLLRSGLVVLDLPGGMSRSGLSALGPGFWLRLSARGDLNLLAGLVGVWTNGVSARRLGPCPDQALPPGRIRAALEATPGLATVRQPWPSFDLQAQEDTAAWTTRVAERLRHRARAITPWDCERLVLQAFPEVFKLKCIPRTEGGPDAPVRMVVVPTLPAGYEIDGTEAPRLDASTLQRIARYLGERMPPQQALLVRNASYERIQVRCTLRLARGEPAGERLRELNQSLRDYLSPWRAGGITTHFDWQLRADEVEAFLRAQAGVAAVGQVSLLHIVQSDDAVFRLYDTARHPAGGEPAADEPGAQAGTQSGGQPGTPPGPQPVNTAPAPAGRVLRPAQPWSLALPTRGHLLELADQPSALAPVSGLGKLTVGRSFIVGRSAA